MNNFEQQKAHDFLQDLKLLAKDYGMGLDDVVSVLGLKHKTHEELILEQVAERYKAGVVFYPLDKIKSKVGSSKNPEFLFDKAWVWTDEEKMCCVWDGGIWAEIVE